jgi:signal transduction histidine kinase
LPWRLVVIFVVLVLVPAGTVIGLGTAFVIQDRDLERRQLHEETARLLTRVVSALTDRIIATERQLGSRQPPGDDAALLVFHENYVETVPPTPLLFHPNYLAEATDSSVFDEGDRAEFAGDLTAADAVFRAKAVEGDSSVRAAALVRLARILRRRRQYDAALHTYDALALVPNALFEGVPVELVARHARCLLFQEQHDRTRLLGEAEALRAGLAAGRWRIDFGTYDQYRGEVIEWTGHDVVPSPSTQLLTDAAAFLWRQRPRSSREEMTLGGQDFVLSWPATTGESVALVAGPAFQERQWFSPLRGTVLPSGVDLSVATRSRPAEGADVQETWTDTLRLVARDPRLPWDLTLATRSSAAGRQRRQLVVAGLATLILLVVIGGYVIARAVARELAIARLQADFVASVSHEFRTPLTSLRQFTELLNDDDEPPADRRKRFYAAQARATERLQRLVESLLDFRRIESGVQPETRQRLHAASLLDRVVEDFRAEASTYGFTVEYDDNGVDAEIDVDPEALSLALWNLLDNALKYSGDSRVIGVLLTRSQGRVAMSVRDHGIGIAVSEQGSIFRKFVRGTEARARGIKGTGLGLAMVQHIVRRHGGRIAVDSAPNRGSTFTIELRAA